jgi:hypothetical protein
LPSDSISLLNLISKISVVTKEMRPADTLLKKAIQKVQLLQTRVNFVTVKLEDGIEQIEKYRAELGRFFVGQRNGQSLGAGCIQKTYERNFFPVKRKSKVGSFFLFKK